MSTLFQWACGTTPAVSVVVRKAPAVALLFTPLPLKFTATDVPALLEQVTPARRHRIKVTFTCLNGLAREVFLISQMEM